MQTTPSNDSLMELTVGEVLRRWPDLYSVFIAEGMGACLGCPIAPFETLQDASEACQVNREKIRLAIRGAMGAES